MSAASPHTPARELFLIACEQEKTEVAKWLMENAQLNQEILGKVPDLYLQAVKKERDTVLYLLEAYYDVTKICDLVGAFNDAIARKRFTIALRLLRRPDEEDLRFTLSELPHFTGTLRELLTGFTSPSKEMMDLVFIALSLGISRSECPELLQIFQLLCLEGRKRFAEILEGSLKITKKEALDTYRLILEKHKTETYVMEWLFDHFKLSHAYFPDRIELSAKQ